MNILIVDDHTLFNDLLSKACRTVLPTTQVFTAVSISQAQLRISERRYDLLLVDIHLPDGDGLAFGVQTMRTLPRVKVVGISADCSEYMIARVFGSPVHGFIDKQSQTLSDALIALQTVASGGKYFSPRAAAVMNALRKAPDSFLKRLSPREISILCKVGDGWSNAQIARFYNITEDTVRWHCKQLMRRLSLDGRTGLMAFANRKGFSDLSSPGFPEELKLGR